MPIDRLRASYILRLTQRLSRLTYELRDVRSGHVHRFDSAAALSCFLDASVAQTIPEPQPHEPARCTAHTPKED